MQLLPADAPNTVTNFLHYVNTGAYAATFFHRSGFRACGIIQGGSYEVQSTVSGRRSRRNPPSPRIQPAQRARHAGHGAHLDPNSATSGWFFNVTDNSSASVRPTAAVTPCSGRSSVLPAIGVMDAIAARARGRRQHDGPQYATAAGGQLRARARSTTSNLIMSPVTVLPDEAPTITITFADQRDAASRPVRRSVRPRFTATRTPTARASRAARPRRSTRALRARRPSRSAATDYAGKRRRSRCRYMVNPAPPGPKRVTPRPPVLLAGWSASKTAQDRAATRMLDRRPLRRSGHAQLKPPHQRTVRIASGRYPIAGYRRGRVTLHLAGRPGLALARRAQAHRQRSSCGRPAARRAPCARSCASAGAETVARLDGRCTPSRRAAARRR